MTEPHFQPSSVTKPIQLLAAWLIGLIAIDTAFLGAASFLKQPAWGPAALVIAAILNVPLFLVCLFLLQTRFRPEMQEDTFFSQYLERKSQQTGKVEIVEVQRGRATSADQINRRKTHIVVETEKANIARINDLLPKYKEIRRDLMKSGIEIGSDFGSSSTSPRLPKNSVLSFDPEGSIVGLQKIVEIAYRHGISGIAISGEDVKEIFPQAYFGAYSYEEGENEFVRLTDSIVEKLTDPNISRKTFLAICSV